MPEGKFKIKIITHTTPFGFGKWGIKPLKNNEKPVPGFFCVLTQCKLYTKYKVSKWQYLNIYSTLSV